MWKSLRHPNVQPLIGVTMTEIHFAMVSEWMVDGNIRVRKDTPGRGPVGACRSFIQGGIAFPSS